MKERILLIDDRESQFNRVSDFFELYDVEFYPADFNEFRDLSINLILYTESDEERKSVLFTKITNYINEKNPTIILLDLNFSGKDDSLNQDGLEFLNWIRKSLSLSTRNFIFSIYEKDGPIDQIEGYIQKEGGETIETQMLELIIKEYGIAEREVADTIEVNTILENTDAVKEKRIIKKYEPNLYEKVSEFLFKVSSSWGPLFVDTLITFTFQLAIITSFLFAPFDIILNSMHKPDAFRIAERCFIAFLPFLIICGFYIFYKKSLRAYFLKTVRDPHKEEDFESASVLMKLTKKLFISSLLSYLFIKLIELLCFEKPEVSTNFFLDYYKITNPFIQLYIIAGLIAILLLYYLLLDKNHKGKIGH